MESFFRLAYLSLRRHALLIFFLMLCVISFHTQTHTHEHVHARSVITNTQSSHATFCSRAIAYLPEHYVIPLSHTNTIYNL
jgi:hypothetical protein